MSTITASPPKTSHPAPAPTRNTHGDATVMRGVRWEDYVRFRDNRGLRMTFDRGLLEIMTLSSLHELVSRIIDLSIHEWR